MRKYLFIKARYLLDKIEIISETDYSISFLVGDNKFHVTLKYQNSKLVGICDCKAGSFEHPCAHIIAAITKLTNK